MKKQFTLVLTKPEAKGQLKTTREELPQVGKVSLEKTVTITEPMIKVMEHPDESEFVKAARRQHLLGRIGIVFVIEGSNIIEDVVTFVGKETNPEKCHPRSLRFRAWNNGDFPLPVLMPNNEEYHFNGFHRTTNDEEFKKQGPVILNGDYERLVSAG